MICVNLPTKWSYKGKPYESDHVMHCMFCKLWRVVALPPDLLAEQPDDTTHVCLNCGHGFALEKPVELTPKQREVLHDIARGKFVSGATVRVVRKLETMGLATLEDNGRLRGEDFPERWWAKATLAGNRALEVRRG